MTKCLSYAFVRGDILLGKLSSKRVKLRGKATRRYDCREHGALVDPAAFRILTQLFEYRDSLNN